MTHRLGWAPSLGFGPLVAAAAFAACFPSFEVGPGASTDAGADHKPDRCVDGSGCRHAETGGSDAPVDVAPEGPACVPIAVPTLPPHGGPACPADGSACYPGDVTGFTPQWIPTVQATPFPGQCAAKQIAEAYASCFGFGATIAGCMAWQGANAQCYGCMVTDSMASRYGPVIVYTNGPNTLTVLNVAGCVALAEPCNQPCALALLADVECDFAACTTGPCAGASSPLVLSCISTSDLFCGCMGYHTSQSCYLNLVDKPSDHPSVNLCNLAGANGFTAANFSAVVSVMCGTPP